MNLCLSFAVALVVMLGLYDLWHTYQENRDA